MSRQNINSNRILTGGDGQLNLNNVAVDQQTSGAPPFFQKAVVQEVIFNPKELTEDDRRRIKSLVSNPNAVDQIAANSVVGILINDGTNQAVPTVVILSPYFQSHFMLPVQAGEQVSVVFEDFQKDGFLAGKWITRISEGLPTEDLNFTHGDRRYNKLNFGNLRTSASVEITSGTYTPYFPNGAGQENTHTLFQRNGAVSPYESIFKISSASLMHSYEVVPRWTKRPQEFVMQGMNNSIIILGQDRIGSVSSSNIDPNEQKKYSGTVDIVAGRSRYLLDKTINTVTSALNKTSPFVVENTRGILEVDKTPRFNSRTEQVKEGDPDFIHDAARLYLSMKTLGDQNFRTQKVSTGNAATALQSNGINYSLNSLSPYQFPSSSQNIGSSYFIGKADHVRLIARRSSPNELPIISGSLLLLKEGNNRTPEDVDAQSATNDHLSYFYMSPEGRVQIDGLQIFLGGAALRQQNQTPPADMPRNTNGSTSEVNVGDENLFAGVEPYIKWTEFKKVVEGLQQQINDLRVAYSGLVDDISNASGNSLCVPYGPDSAWAAVAASAGNKVSTMNQNITTHRTQTNQSVYKSRSVKIFGQ